MNITIKVDAPEIVEAINNLAHSLSNLSASGNAVGELLEKVVEQHQLPEVGEKVTHDAVKSVLAEIARNGKQAEVKALLGKYGVTKLSDLPPDQLANIAKDAEAIV